MKKWAVISLLVVVLAGCQYGGSRAIIDWVDFIKWDGESYLGIYTGVLADERYIGEKIGKVKFKVADNISDPSYKTKDGDAAFLEKGTEIFSIKGRPDLLAVKAEETINGYQVYFASDSTKFKWHFKDMPVDKVKKIEIYLAYTEEGNKKLADINDNNDIDAFLDILTNSKEDSAFQPNTENGDPRYYNIVLYTDDPIAYKYGVQFDGETYFWYPWDTALLSSEIKRFIPEM
ncbi:hypothetical protein [Solibacillus sp. CAU 1738]|uniref:hypothetical protein n=1 Tax=Solibacillus sp. CAU 1738 TaxID=3140363 RepID=UPI00326151BA